MQSKISVVIPMFNAERTIERTIQSVINQKYNLIEIIIVDDGSTDMSVEVVKSVQQGMPEHISLKYYVNTGKGAPAARNLGLTKSEGDLIQFLDADDELLPDKLQRQCESIQRNHADVSITKYVTLQNGHRRAPNYGDLPASNQINVDWLLSNIITTNAALYRRSCLVSVGGWDESLEAAQDWDLNLRFGLMGKKFDCVNETLVINHGQPNSISSNLDRVNQGVLQSLESNATLLRPHYTQLNHGLKFIVEACYQLTINNVVDTTRTSLIVRRLPLKRLIKLTVWYRYILITNFPFLRFLTKMKIVE